MKPLILVAASGLAREAREAAEAQGEYKVVGAVDDDLARHGTDVAGLRVLGGFDVVADYPDASLLICVGKGSAREAITHRLGADPSRYATVVHPSAAVAATCTVGPGTIILAGCVATSCVRIGSHVVVMPNVTLTHDDEIASYATLCAGVTLGGGVRIGERTYLGMASSVREQLTIAAGATVGMGAVVVDDVPAGQCWRGVPARHVETPAERKS
jgi:sugar O-acyltransferase (sialic acid O-acetyltransferase NeuD family)